MSGKQRLVYALLLALLSATTTVCFMRVSDGFLWMFVVIIVAVFANEVD